MLLVAMPLSWFAPLLRTSTLPFFAPDEISIVSGLQSLWKSDAAFALLVTFLAVFAPFAKVSGLMLVQLGLLSRRAMPVLALLGKLAMADIFLIALYLLVIKGAGFVTIETAWGLWLFTLCVLSSIFIAWRAEKDPRDAR